MPGAPSRSFGLLWLAHLFCRRGVSPSPSQTASAAASTSISIRTAASRWRSLEVQTSHFPCRARTAALRGSRASALARQLQGRASDRLVEASQGTSDKVHPDPPCLHSQACLPEQACLFGEIVHTLTPVGPWTCSCKVRGET